MTLSFDNKYQNALALKVARIFNTDQPRMDNPDVCLVSSFTVQSSMGQPVTNLGTRQQSRCSCYMDEMAGDLIVMMQSNFSVVAPISRSTPAEFTLVEPAQRALKKAGSRSDLVFQPLLQDDPSRRRPKIECAKLIIKWESKLPLTNADRSIACFDRLISDRTSA